MPDLPYTDRELQRLSSTLRSLARRLVLDDETADDLVQEAWLAALEQPPARVRDMTGWLRTVMRNMAVRHHVRRARRREIEERASRAEADDGLDRLAEQLSSIRLLQRTAEKLDEPYRTVIHLRFFEELSVAEVAERLDRPHATVKSQVARGLQRMRDELDGAFHGDRRAWALTLLAGLDGLRESTPGPATAAREPLADRSDATTRPLRTRILVGAAATLGLLATATFLGLDAAPTPAPAQPPVAAAERADAALQPPREPLAPRATAADDVVATEPEAQADETPVPADRHRLVVDVVDANGTPVPTAVVTLAGQPARYPCDGAGRAELLLPQSVAYRTNDGAGASVVARAPGHAESHAHQVHLPPEALGQTRQVRIQLRSPEVVIEIEIVDQDGQPVRGAVVTTFGPMVQDRRNADGIHLTEPRRTIGVPNDGRYRIENLAQVERTYQVRAPGYPYLSHIEPARGPDVRQLRLVLGRGATLSGVVLDPDGSALANARVWTDVGPDIGRNPAETRTDANGKFRLEGLDPGLHFFFARDPLDPEWVAHFERELTPEEETYWEATVEPRPGVRLQCLFADGRPLVGSSVILRPADHRNYDWTFLGATDAEGRVYAHPVPDGLFEVTVLGHGIRETLKAALVVPEMEASFEERVLEVEEHEIPEGRLTGVYRDWQDEVPADARLRLENVDSPYHRRATTDTSGNFYFRNVPEGRYELIVRLGGIGLAHLGTVDMEPKGEVDLGIVKSPPPTRVEVDWLWPRDEPSRVTVQTGAWFPHRTDIWRWQPIVENAPGPLPEVLELLPGHHAIIVERPGHPPQQRKIYLESDPLHVVFGPEEIFPQGFRIGPDVSRGSGGVVVVGRLTTQELSMPTEDLDLALLEIVREDRVDPGPDTALDFELTLTVGSYLIEAHLDDGRTLRHRFTLDEVPTTRAPHPNRALVDTASRYGAGHSSDVLGRKSTAHPRVEP